MEITTSERAPTHEGRRERANPSPSARGGHENDTTCGDLRPIVTPAALAWNPASMDQPADLDPRRRSARRIRRATARPIPARSPGARESTGQPGRRIEHPRRDRAERRQSVRVRGPGGPAIPPTEDPAAEDDLTRRVRREGQGPGRRVPGSSRACDTGWNPQGNPTAITPLSPLRVACVRPEPPAEVVPQGDCIPFAPRPIAGVVLVASKPSPRCAELQLGSDPRLLTAEPNTPFRLREKA
jgi:hypothetical protein